jgi:sporulation protein YlmC with PRC-barrel domain
MAHIDMDTVLDWRGRTVLDRDGEKIGKLGDVFLDAETDRPAWAGVQTGLFGNKESFVPLEDVREVEDGLQVPYDKDHVKDAPQIDPDVALTVDEEESLHRHYGRSYDRVTAEGPAGAPRDERDAGATSGERKVEREAGATSGEGQLERESAAPSGEGGEMVRSEEEVRVGTSEAQPVERVRLKKVLVTDNVKKVVPVRREEIRLEQDPPPDDEER